MVKTASKPKVKMSCYVSTGTWDRLVRFLNRRYGPNTKATSLTVEQAINLYLDQENEPPATA